MSNSFYNATGNPVTGSGILSSVIRAEFSAIAAGFGMFPSLPLSPGSALVVKQDGSGLAATVGDLALSSNFTTTGAFTTTFAQVANVTLTLPAVSGSMALFSDVAAETARALDAEAAITYQAGTGAAGITTIVLQTIGII